VESAPLMVVKETGNREPFDRAKLTRSLMRICQRTSVTEAQIEAVVGSVDAALQQRVNREILSGEISELVLQELNALNEAACIRYASAYCEFETVPEFLATLTRLTSDQESSSNAIEAPSVQLLN
jgi:transcriptional repressor NrdR